MFCSNLAAAEESENGLCALTTTWEYDQGGRQIRETAPDGVITLHSYDAAGNETLTEVETSDGTLVTRTKKEYNIRGEVIAETDALGSVTKYTYDHRGNLIKTEDALGGISLFTYNYNDQKTAEVSPANYRPGKKLREMARTEYTYDNAGRLFTQIDYEFDEAKIHSSDWPQGFHSKVSATYIYDNARNTTQIRDAEGRGTIYTYHPNGLVATSKTAAEQAKMEGIALSYCYDILGNTVGLRAGEYEHRYSYDPEGRLLSESDNYGTIRTCTYDALGRLQTETDGVGATTYYAYNALGEISWQKLPGDETVPELEIFYRYDHSGRLAEQKDSTGVCTTYTYDCLGSLLTQTIYDTETKESLTINYTYDALGNCTSATDASGTYTEYCYDALGRKISESLYTAGGDAEPKTTKWEHDADGHNTLTRDFLGNETRTEYDSLGRIKAQYDAFNYPVLTYQYNDCDQQISSTDALGNKTTYTYDGDGNVITATAPDGAVTTYTYDYAGNQITKTDSKGNQTRYVYDGRNRLLSVVNALGEAYTYHYDNADRQTEQIDPAGKGILYTYNVRGDLATRRYLGEQAQETYHYTAKGNLAEKISRNGIATVYTYDGFGRLLTERAGTDQKTYTYDKVGNLLTTTANGITTTRTYDAQGRVTSKTVDGIGTIRYLYDLDPRNGEVSEQSIAPDGVTKETRYDKAGRIAFVDLNDGTSVLESYYKNGSRKSSSTDRGMQEYYYDAAGRVIKLTHKNTNGQETESYSYVYDANGNLIEEESSHGTIRYTYDALDRLISVTEPEGKITGYTYDASGNRAAKTEWNAGRTIQTTYTYNAANLLIKQESDNGTIILYTYDENGNLIQEETTGKEVQEENLVLFSEKEPETITGSAINTEVPGFFPGVQEAVTGSTVSTEVLGSFPEVQNPVTGSTITSPPFPEDLETVTGGAISEPISGSAIRCYTYDNFNRLISYQNGDTFAAYTYDAEDYRIGKQVMDSDGEKFTRYFYEGNHVVLEADESGRITAHNTYSINLIRRTVGEKGYYYFYNAHGDVVKLIGIQGEEEVLYRYDAFGTLVEVTGDADNSITYAGYQYDKESGLYYLNARYYDSTTARFLTEDTYTGKSNDPLSLHRYTYCANNPLRYTDPDGHFFGALFRFVTGAVVGAVTEYVSQKFIEKRDTINVKAILYEGVVGGVTSVIGGVGGAAKKAEKTVKAVKSAKTVVKSAIKTGAKEAASSFVEDVGYQVFVEEKSLADVDYGQAAKAGATSGIGAMLGELDDAFGSKKQLSAANRKKASQATGLIDDAADMTPRPRANALPNVEATPSHGAVRDTAGELTNTLGNAGNSTARRSSTVVGNQTLNQAAESRTRTLSKNQQRIQSQTVSSRLSSDNINVTAQNRADARYLRTGYQPGTKSNNLFLEDRAAKRAKNVTEWRRPIDKKNIAEEKRMFLGDNYVKVDKGKWRSIDGKRQVRTKNVDYLGVHGIGKPTVDHISHIHFEFLKLANNGQRYDVIKNIHIQLK